MILRNRSLLALLTAELVSRRRNGVPASRRADGPLAAVIILMNALGQMLGASLPVLAFQRYGNPKVGGWLFAAYGLGGLVGTVIAFRLVTKVAPLILASFAALGFALPLWVLVPHVPLAPILPHWLSLPSASRFSTRR